jgi:Transposase IS4
MVGLLQRLTRPLWHTGKVVVLDSGFCVLMALIELRKRGVFAAALIKKRRYWPKFIDGNAIIKHFADMEIGDIDSLPGRMIEANRETKFHVVCLKEPEYVMMLMSTYGTMERLGEIKTRHFTDDAGTKKIKTFQYPEVIRNHYEYRDAVDAHNSSRMYPIALEETCKTHRWPMRVFQFLLAITEVNCRLAREKIFDHEKESQQDFRRLFAKALIDNSYILEEISNTERSRRSSVSAGQVHIFWTIPPGKIFDRDGQLVTTKTKYHQRYCQCRSHHCRTYCSCSPGTIQCPDCFATHMTEVQLVP